MAESAQLLTYLKVALLMLAESGSVNLAESGFINLAESGC